MASITVKVATGIGLHARPAAVIARSAASFESPVTLQMDSGGEPIDAASTLMVMMLGAQCGDAITVSSPDEAACAEVANLIATDLDADS